MAKRLEIKIYGKVLGVGFRFCAYQKFDELALSGQAANDPEGCVRIEAQGEEPALEQFVKWCNTGPAGARVSRVEVSEKELIAGTKNPGEK